MNSDNPPSIPEEIEDLNYELEFERSVGIEGYTTSTVPIGGQIKQEFSDFIVREILLSGEILSTYEHNDPEIQYNPKRDKYTHCTIIKRNFDTIHVAKILQSFLGVKEQDITWAGIKDNTAITAQRFCILGNHVKKLLTFQYKNITISDIQPSGNQITLGQLWGNNFAINIRNVNNSYGELQSLLSDWKAQIELNGFPNFYGLQRFGQHRPNSHYVGKALLMQDFKKAVEEFLFNVYPLEFEEMAEFRRWAGECKDYPLILAKIPKALNYERMMVEVLAKDPTNFKGAIQALPRPLIHLILSSYQSFLFNKVVSTRLIQKIPLSKPVPGDIISILGEEKGLASLAFYRYGQWHDYAIEKAFKMNRATIVAPVPGYDTDLAEYPFFKPLYEQVMAEEGFSPHAFTSEFASQFRFRGTFRPIIQKPTSFSIAQAHALNKTTTFDSNGVHLEFSLPKGTYATMLLRELIKKPTGRQR